VATSTSLMEQAALLRAAAQQLEQAGATNLATAQHTNARAGKSAC
jgi:hypothetical protein